MNGFRILPIDEDIAGRVRATRSDGYGNERIQATVAQEAGALPCRMCLEDAAVGDELLLFSYSPFERPVPYRYLGPIFVHARACVPYESHEVVPALIRRRLLALRGYDAEGRMQECDIAQGAEIEPLVERFFANPVVVTIHVHNARAGCFVCRIERAP